MNSIPKYIDEELLNTIFYIIEFEELPLENTNYFDYFIDTLYLEIPHEAAKVHLEKPRESVYINKYLFNKIHPLSTIKQIEDIFSLKNKKVFSLEYPNYSESFYFPNSESLAKRKFDEFPEFYFELYYN